MENFIRIEYRYRKKDESSESLIVLKNDKEKFSLYIVDSMSSQIYYEFSSQQAAQDYMDRYTEICDLTLIDKKIISH